MDLDEAYGKSRLGETRLTVGALQGKGFNPSPALWVSSIYHGDNNSTFLTGLMY